jgi:hypothetical protein
VSLQAPLRRGSSLERSSRHGAMFLHLREPHAPLLALLPAQQSDFSRHRAWGFGHSRPMRAALAELDEGEFTEGHELDRKTAKQVPKAMIGRRLSQEEAKRLLAKFD